MLTHVHLDGIDKSQVEIQRSPVDDFYYIRKKPSKAVTKAEDALETPTPITIDFILHTPEPVEVIAAQPISDDLPEGIRAIIKFCQNFGVGDCGLTPDMTGIAEIIVVDRKKNGRVSASEYGVCGDDARAISRNSRIYHWKRCTYVFRNCF